MDQAQAEATLEKAKPVPLGGRAALRRGLRPLRLPGLALLTALIVGAIFIIVTDEQILAAAGNFFSDPLGFFTLTLGKIAWAYAALIQGAVSNPLDIIAGLFTYITTGDNSTFLRSLRPISESLVRATPFIFAGLAVGLGFRAGLFNIGAEGQLIMGGLFSVYVGYAFTGLPIFIHLPLALAAGFLGGALWGFIPGFLKARVGAHEVINTIMLNWIAILFSRWILAGPLSRDGFVPISPNVLPSAALPQFFPNPIRFHAGFFLALGVAYLVWWFLFKTTAGFELRSVGANPSAARAAGMNIGRNIILAMVLSGGLAGLAGTIDVLGWRYNMGVDFAAGVGFDSIAVALIARSHPIGIIFSGLLFGMLRAGTKQMEAIAHVPVDIVFILQALIIMFVAAPEIIRLLYRIRVERGVEEAVLTRGWQQK
ncbi:MAG: ABC transporter permease [Chloroflexi bacterium]|nr:ABC transporter permease [Chloroflexota bacterium]